MSAGTGKTQARRGYTIPREDLERVAQGERLHFHPADGPAFAVVPIEDAEYMERREDELDNRLADEALAEEGGVPIEELMARYGIDPR
jgi:hypothetical protein